MSKVQDRQKVAASKAEKIKQELAQGAAVVRWGERFNAAEGKSCDLRHHAGLALLEAVSLHATVGALAAAIHRGRTDVQNALAAMRLYPAVPSTDRDRSRFAAAWGGNLKRWERIEAARREREAAKELGEKPGEAEGSGESSGRTRSQVDRLAQFTALCRRMDADGYGAADMLEAMESAIGRSALVAGIAHREQVWADDASADAEREAQDAPVVVTVTTPSGAALAESVRPVRMLPAPQLVAA